MIKWVYLPRSCAFAVAQSMITYCRASFKPREICCKTQLFS